MSLRDLPEIRAFDQLAETPTENWRDDVEGYDETIVAADNTDINIYGVIGRDPAGDDNSERRISAALRSIGEKDIRVNLNSPGGSFYSGLSIYNLLRQHNAKVTINVVGMAGSAASVIAMAGDEIMMAEGATIMVHSASAMAIGNRFDLSDITEALTEVDADMARLYAARSGATPDVAAEWMERNRGGGTRFSADDAISKGLADGKLPKSAIRAEDKRSMPVERRIERALMHGKKLSAADAKSLIGELKNGERDAAELSARDAGPTAETINRLLQTMTSHKD